MTSPHNQQLENEPAPNGPLAPEIVRKEVRAVMTPGNFFVGPSLQLSWSHKHEVVFWEIFRGRVLDRSQTRERRQFTAWNIREMNTAVVDDEPILSVKFDAEAGEIHVTRSILVYAWEAYADDDGAIQSRETVKRNRELIGSLSTLDYRSAEQLRADLSELFFLADVGTSRLPLTSEESPQPAFTFGQWMFCYRPNASGTPCSDPSEWIATSLRPELSWRQKARLLEFAIRACVAGDIDKVVEVWLSQWRTAGHERGDLLRLIRTLVEEISLSPYTDFVTKLLRFLKVLVRFQFISPADEADFLTFQLRQLWRHLNAYDLIRFHHRGANYPDALLLDELIHRLFEIVDADPELFVPQVSDSTSECKRKQHRRSGLRVGWCLRCQYAGLPVPELPTSPGENSRVLPAPYRRLSEDEILNPAKRSHRLFETELNLSDSVRGILAQTIIDLNDSGELRELGAAIFLDRPLGFSKHPGEPDRTPLLSYVAFSRKLARERLQQLSRCAGLDDVLPRLPLLDRRLESREFSIGVMRPNAKPTQRPGVASLEDAQLATDDFAFIRTTRRSLQDFLNWFDLTPLAGHGFSPILSPGKCLLLRDEQRPDHLWVYDDCWQKRWLLRIDPNGSFVSRPGVELPRNGLEALPVGGDARSEEFIRLPLKRAL